MLAVLTDPLFVQGVLLGMPIGATGLVGLVLFIALIKKPNLSG
jgi:hypothetical protein